MATTTPVVMPIVGKLLVNGSATETISDFRPEPISFWLSSAIAPTAVIAKISGGCTIGPNRLFLRTRQIAPTQPTMKAPW